MLCGSDVQPLNFPVLCSHLQSSNWFLLQQRHAIVGRSIRRMTSPQEYLKSHRKLKNKYKMLLTMAPQIKELRNCNWPVEENGQLEKYMRWCTGNERRLRDFGGDDDEDNGFYTASSLTGDTHKCSVMAGTRDVLAQRWWMRPKKRVYLPV